MTMDEWNALRNWLIEVRKYFVNIIQRVTDALAKIFDVLEKIKKQKDTKPNNYFNNQYRKKNQYLCNAKSTHRMMKKPRKNLPYQRRNC